MHVSRQLDYDVQATVYRVVYSKTTERLDLRVCQGHE